MRMLRRKNRGPGDKPRDHGHPSSVEVIARPRPSNDDDLTSFFDDEDWDQINDLLSRHDQGDSPSHFESSNDGVTSSLAELRASLGGQIVASQPVLDRLLDVWALVHQVEPLAARPAESLISSLVARDLVSAKEVSDTCDEIEAALGA
jgi:hypothetical protein